MDFRAVKDTCRKNSNISEEVIDDFLMYYAAQRDKLEPEINQRLSRFKHISGDFPAGMLNKFKAQYIVHRIFRQDGLIRKYLNHSELKRLDAEQMAFLRFQEQHPWRFSFSVITGNPADDFYNMEDAFNGEKFLLYSPGITQTLSEQPVQLWFNLIAFNGSCWQTFGPIVAFQSFLPDDIFFFGSEVNPGKWLESDDDLMQEIEKNPVPYMMLARASRLPLNYGKSYLIVYCISEVEADNFEPRALEQHFRIEYSSGVYKLSLKKWSSFPHFACLYYEEEAGILTLSAMTDKGYEKLAQ